MMNMRDKNPTQQLMTRKTTLSTKRVTFDLPHKKMTLDPIPSRIKYFFLSLLLLFKLIFILTIFAPVFLSRWIIRNLAKVFRPDLYKMLNRFNSVFTVGDADLEERNTVILTMKIGGKLNYESILSTVSKFVYETKADGELLYPEFHLYWEAWLGYPFWKWEKHFRVQNHVVREKPVMDCRNNNPDFDPEDYITEFEKALLQRPFEEKKSPWEITVIECGAPAQGSDDVHCDCDSSWVLFFKFHHSIADGYSIFNVLMRCSDNNGNFLEIPTGPRAPQISGIRRAWSSLTFPFAAAYEIVRLDAAMSKSNPMRLPTSKTIYAPKVIVKSNRISLAELKKRSKAANTSFTAALISAISLGTQRYLKAEGKQVPEFLPAQLPVPVPNRPAGLTNHFSMVCLKLPTGLRNSEVQRLRVCEEEIEHAKKSKYKEAMWVMIKLLGSLPIWLQKRMEHVGSCVEIASFPGPKQPVTFYGQPILDMYYNVVCGQYSLDLCILSYNGVIRIVANADPHIFPSEDQLGDLVREIEEEIGRKVENSKEVAVIEIV